MKNKEKKQNVIFGCDKVLIIFFSFCPLRHFFPSQCNLSQKKKKFVTTIILGNEDKKYFLLVKLLNFYYEPFSLRTTSFKDENKFLGCWSGGTHSCFLVLLFFVPQLLNSFHKFYLEKLLSKTKCFLSKFSFKHLHNIKFLNET